MYIPSSSDPQPPLECSILAFGPPTPASSTTTALPPGESQRGRSLSRSSSPSSSTSAVLLLSPSSVESDTLNPIPEYSRADYAEVPPNAHSWLNAALRREVARMQAVHTGSANGPPPIDAGSTPTNPDLMASKARPSVSTGPFNASIEAATFQRWPQMYAMRAEDGSVRSQPPASVSHVDVHQPQISNPINHVHQFPASNPMARVLQPATSNPMLASHVYRHPVSNPMSYVHVDESRAPYPLSQVQQLPTSNPVPAQPLPSAWRQWEGLQLSPSSPYIPLRVHDSGSPGLFGPRSPSEELYPAFEFAAPGSPGLFGPRSPRDERYHSDLDSTVPNTPTALSTVSEVTEPRSSLVRSGIAAASPSSISPHGALNAPAPKVTSIRTPTLCRVGSRSSSFPSVHSHVSVPQHSPILSPNGNEARPALTAVSVSPSIFGDRRLSPSRSPSPSTYRSRSRSASPSYVAPARTTLRGFQGRSRSRSRSPTSSVVIEPRRRSRSPQPRATIILSPRSRSRSRSSSRSRSRTPRILVMPPVPAPAERPTRHCSRSRSPSRRVPASRVVGRAAGQRRGGYPSEFYDGHVPSTRPVYNNLPFAADPPRTTNSAERAQDQSHRSIGSDPWHVPQVRLDRSPSVAYSTTSATSTTAHTPPPRVVTSGMTPPPGLTGVCTPPLPGSTVHYYDAVGNLMPVYYPPSAQGPAAPFATTTATQASSAYVPFANSASWASAPAPAPAPVAGGQPSPPGYQSYSQGWGVGMQGTRFGEGLPAFHSWGPAVDPWTTRTLHPRYYFEDGDVEAYIGDVMYKLHSYLFKQLGDSSPFYCGQFPAPFRGCYRGRHDLEESRTDFDRLLSVLYPADYDAHECKTAEEWISVLLLASKWNMKSIRRLAIKQLSTFAGVVDKIALGHRYDVPEWLGPAYMELAMRREPITAAEGAKLGTDALVRLNALKDEVFSNLPAYVDEAKLSDLFQQKVGM